jgi:hypothetical protein
VALSGKHLPFLKSTPRHPSGWRGFYFTTRAIAAATRATDPALASDLVRYSGLSPSAINWFPAAMLFEREFSELCRIPGFALP